MFTVASLRQYPDLVKAFTGLPTEGFWGLVAAVGPTRSARRARPDRLRAIGGGAGAHSRWCGWRWC